MEGGVILRGMLVSLNSKLGHSFVTDCTRAGEGLITDDAVREKYGLSVEVWRNNVKNKALVRAVQSEHEQRSRNGVAAREAAAQQTPCCGDAS